MKLMMKLGRAGIAIDCGGGFDQTNDYDNIRCSKNPYTSQSNRIFLGSNPILGLFFLGLVQSLSQDILLFLGMVFVLKGHLLCFKNMGVTLGYTPQN